MKSLTLNISKYLGCLYLMLHLINCGGVVVGNPHGSGGGSGTNTGSIRLSVGDPMSRSFSQVFFNVKGIHLIGVETSNIVALPSTKKINAAESRAMRSPESMIEIAAAAGSYEAIVLELDNVNPINITKKDGKTGKIINAQQSSFVTIAQEFTVSVNTTADLEFYIDLDRSFKTSSVGSAVYGDGEEPYEFDPKGVLDFSNSIRTMTGTVSGSMADRVCVYTVSGDSVASLPGAAPASTGSDSKDIMAPYATSPAQAAALEKMYKDPRYANRSVYVDEAYRYSATPAPVIAADVTCQDAVQVQTNVVGDFSFYGLLPDLYTVVVYFGSKTSESSVDLRDKDRSDVVLNTGNDSSSDTSNIIIGQ